MTKICGYNIELWKVLGFNFPEVASLEKYRTLFGQKQFGKYIYSLTIRGETGYTLAKIENLQHQKLANHIVSEDEAIRWFSEKSEEFDICYKSCKDKEK